MIEIALYQPEIPSNTGNVIRLCANTGAVLHLIQPLGFVWDDRRLRRAGLDYHDLTVVRRHRDFAAFLKHACNRRLWGLSTHGRRRFDQARYASGDIVMLGPETRGLPAEVMDDLPSDQVLRIPMVKASRSLNLANACGIVLFEALRQLDYPDLV